MSRHRQSQHWEIKGHDEVAEELEKALAWFGTQSAAAEGEFTASLRHLKTFGQHPEELKHWGAYRCFPTVVWPDAVLYTLFRDIEEVLIVILHVTLIVVRHLPGQLNDPPPDLPRAAWNLANLRFETRQW